jgi:hypothetical protein
MSPKTITIIGMASIFVQQIVCCISLELFDFVYFYEDRISARTFDLKNWPLSLKGAVMFVVYYLYVLGPLILLNTIGLLLFFKLNSKYNALRSIVLGYSIACFCVFLSYVLSFISWYLILASHGFPERFPDNLWDGLFVKFTPYYPGVVIYLLCRTGYAALW